MMRLPYSRALTLAGLVISLLLSTGSRPLAFSQSGNIEDQVKAAIDDSRKGDTQEGLVGALRNSADRIKAIPYLKSYVFDPDERVMGALLTLVTGVHTPEAIYILVAILRREHFESSSGAARILYDFYTCDEIPRQDVGLRDRLQALAGTGSVLFAAKPMLVLCCFRNDESVLRFLEKQRSAKTAVMLDFGMPSVPISVCADVALANLGNVQALRRVLAYIDAGEIDTLYFLLKAIKSINNKAALQKLTQLLKDNRDIGPTCSHCETRFRISDLAVYAFGNQLGIDIGVIPQEFRRYEAAEIGLAYERIQTWLKTRNEKPK